MKTAIIPAIDLYEGNCVRLSQGKYEDIEVYQKDPLLQAQIFEDAGIKQLHLVDLEGAKNSTIIHHKTLEKIASKTNLKVDFGGGVKTKELAKVALDYGASQINIGSLAVAKPDTFIEIGKEFGWEKVILSADSNNNKIAFNGWKNLSEFSLNDFISKFYEQGLEYITVTDISKDGMLSGVNENMYKALQNDFSKLKITASGGVKSVEDLDFAIENKLYAILVGKAYYKGNITIENLKKYTY